MSEKKQLIALPPMTPHEKDALFANLLRLRELFETGKEHIKPEHFDRRVDAIYLLAWRAVCSAVDKHGKDKIFGPGTKPRFLVETEAGSIMHSEPDLVSAEQYDSVFGDEDSSLFKFIYEGVPEENLDRNAAYHWLRKFLGEALQREAFGVARRHENHIIPALPEIFGDIAKKYAEVESIGKSVSDRMFADDWRPKKLNIRSTGITFLDQYMRGGRVDGEVYGILGCYGSGKTTLAIQMAYRGALMDQQLFDAKAEPELGWWYLFHYEAPEEEIKTRLLSHAADILRKEVEDNDPVERPFSTIKDPSSYKDYELTRYKLDLQLGINPPGEEERKDAAIARINRNILAIDMTGAPDKDGVSRGSGYVGEIAQVLAAEKARGRKISGVIVDYVGLAAKRYLAAKSGKMDDLRHLVGGFPDAALQKIALPFNCHVWLFHQVSAAANNMSPTAQLNHTHSAEGKNFGENLWYAFTLNKEDPNTHCRTFSRSKARRSPGEEGMPQLLVIDEFGTLKVSDKWLLNGNYASPKSPVEVDEQTISTVFKTNAAPNHEASLAEGEIPTEFGSDY